MAEPVISDAAFDEYLRQGKLMGSRCAKCDRLFAPPRGWCPHCHQAELHWQPLTGEGRVVAFTCIYIGPPWMAERGFDRHHPYCSAVIELAEGPRVVARLDGVDARHPESITIGLRVAIQFPNGSELVFTPRAGEPAE